MVHSPPAVVHDLVSSGTLAGTLHGHMDKAVYIPHVYTRMQNRWADSFLQSNGYLGECLHWSLKYVLSMACLVLKMVAIFWELKM